MATKPTRQQQQACEHLADALFLIAEAFRLDGKGKLSSADFDEVAAKITGVSSQFPLDEIVVKALERRGKALALTSSTADLITLMEGGAQTSAHTVTSRSRLRGAGQEVGRRTGRGLRVPGQVGHYPGRAGTSRYQAHFFRFV